MGKIYNYFKWIFVLLYFILWYIIIYIVNMSMPE